MNRLHIAIVIWPLIAVTAFGLSGCNAASDEPSPINTAMPTQNAALRTPTAVATIGASLSTPEPTVIADPRIAQFRSQGIQVSKECTAPCSIDVIPDMRLDQFVQKVGAPEKVYASYGGTPVFYAVLIYATRGFMVHAFRYDDGDLTMTPEMMVGRIDLWNARSLSELRQEFMSLWHFDMPFEKAQDWSGFGPIRKLPK